jgi:DNA-binding transcriptional MerR regulator
MTIQEFSIRTRLSEHTLRYYEKIGVLNSIKRNKNGYRDYNEDDIRYIEFIIRLKETGMSIENIKKYADLRNQGEATYYERLVLLEEHQKYIEDELQKTGSNLQKIKEKIEFYKYK